MAKGLNVTQLVSKQDFDRFHESCLSKYGLIVELLDLQGRQVRKLCTSNCNPEFCALVKSTEAGERKCRNERIRSINIAIETGQPYITICHAGILLAGIPIMHKDAPLGGLFFGKCLWEEPSESLLADIFDRLHGLVEPGDELRDAFMQLPVIATRTFFELSNALFVLFYEMCGLDPQFVNWRKELSSQQSQIGEFIQQEKQKALNQGYPYQYERQLREKVATGDRSGTRDILNCMLAIIMLDNPRDLDVFKARLLELVSILSRSAVDGGADVNIVLHKNLDYIKRLMEIKTQEELSAWTGKATYDFIELVYEMQDARKITKIEPALKYIRSNYTTQISLEDVAQSVHLSVSRLSHIFKDQLGMTVVDYISKIRIDRAKQLLLYSDKTVTEICYEVGYNNQSYFSRTFRKHASLTPQKFRKTNKR